MINILSIFFSLPHHQTKVLGGLAALTVDNLYIRADPVFRYCNNWVTNDDRIKAVLGDGLQPGDLRSYRLDSGRVELASSDTSSGSESAKEDKKGSSLMARPVWRPPRIQMIFDVTATGPPYRTGLVTCEAIKYSSTWWWPGSGLHTTLLKVDYETGTGNDNEQEGDETIFLVGSPEDASRVSKRSGLSLDMLARAVHINRAAASSTKEGP